MLLYYIESRPEVEFHSYILYVSIVAVGESNRADYAETFYGDDDQ